MGWTERKNRQSSRGEGRGKTYRLRPPKFHPVLVVIDMQNGFCAQGGSYQKFGEDISIYRKIIPNVKKIIDVCHQLGIPVFYTQQVREVSGIDLLTRIHRIIPRRRLEFIEKVAACISGTWDAEIISELAPTKDDHIVVKRRDSAFQDTEFELWLKSLGADTIIYTGIDTCICVENSIREGFNKGYDVILVEDAVASSWPELHQATLDKVRGSFGLVLTTEQLINMLRTTKRRALAFTLSTEYL
ncbi:cysteine hydrolase [Dehalococcoidales bacterium]|nr:cysteine hydrolase [Dehalococcoidales bacterium]MCL0094579.1 cysteine hydrolase [Dehalococcoidales bacterium]